MIVLETSDSILDSKCQTLVCPVSHAGLFNSSELERKFRLKFNGLSNSSVRANNREVFSIKGIHCFNANNGQKIVLAPVSKHWRYGCKIDLIEKSLIVISKTYKDYGITELAIPYIGYMEKDATITKEMIHDLIVKHLSNISLEVTIHTP